ncbi:hypothetical protein QTP88_003761 [Uroleucon formosanum]
MENINAAAVASSDDDRSAFNRSSADKPSTVIRDLHTTVGMKFGRPKQNGHRLWLSVSKVCVREISLTGQTNGQREINRRLLHALHYRQNAIHAIPRGKLCTCA